MYNQHTRRMAITRHRSLVERGKKMGLAHRKTMSGKPDIHEIKKKCFEHIELPAKLLVYFLRSNKSETSINHSSKATSLFLTKQLKKHQ